MTLIEIFLLLFLVVDPFGNLPIVLAVLRKHSNRDYCRAISREMLLAFGFLLVFALSGDRILGYLNIEQSSLAVAGGVILFLISLKMIFKSASEIFESHYNDDPLLVPIAVPSIAGPSAITTVIILRTEQEVPLVLLLGALVMVTLLTWVIFLIGRSVSTWLGPRGLNAMEKLMGLLLNLVAVNMMMSGLREFLAAV